MPTNEEKRQLVLDWLKETYDMKMIEAKASEAMIFVRRHHVTDEDGDYTTWVQELVSGAHGVYTVSTLIAEAFGTNQQAYADANDEDEVMHDFDRVTKTIARYINQRTSMRGTFTVGHHEADGSIGIFYTEVNESKGDE